MTILAFATGALGVDGVVERAVAVERDAHLAAKFDVDIFDAAFAFEELLVGAGLLRGDRKEEGAAKALSAVAVGVLELIGGRHAELDGTTRSAIGVAVENGMGVLVERHGTDAVMARGAFIDIPGIEGGIGRHMGGVEAQSNDGALIERAKVGHVILVEGLGELRQHHIAIGWDGGRRHAGAIAP